MTFRSKHILIRKYVDRRGNIRQYQTFYRYKWRAYVRGWIWLYLFEEKERQKGNKISFIVR